MKNGMGKTTFVKMLDGAAYAQTKIKGVMYRAFYINAVYSHSKLTFLQGLTDSMRRAENGDLLVSDIPTVEVNSPKVKIQVANLINKLFDANFCTQASKFNHPLADDVLELIEIAESFFLITGKIFLKDLILLGIFLVFRADFWRWNAV